MTGSDGVVNSGPGPAIRQSVLLGLIGDNIQNSLSPILYKGEAAARGVRADYCLIDTKKLGLASADMSLAFRALSILGFHGANVTHPCKEAGFELVSGLSEDARRIGAVNTILRTSADRWTGYNTDWIGFLKSFRRDLPDAQAGHVLLIGAGGAGRAVAYAMLMQGVDRLEVFDVDHPRADGLVERLAPYFPGRRLSAIRSLDHVAGRAEGIINASPLGMIGNPGLPAPIEYLDAAVWVADIVLAPRETELIGAARARGCAVLNGVGMFVAQAAEAFKLFFGFEPDIERMMKMAQGSLCMPRALPGA